MTKRFWLAVLAYLLPTFALGFVWHLILFEDYYAALQIYRRDIIVPFGFLSMSIQAVLFAWLYGKAFAAQSGGWLARGLRYAVTGGLLSWSFTTLAVAAKNSDGLRSGLPADRDRFHGRAVDHRRPADGRRVRCAAERRARRGVT